MFSDCFIFFVLVGVVLKLSCVFCSAQTSSQEVAAEELADPDLAATLSDIDLECGMGQHFFK